jgi:membrane-associated phospholipid phosphatase
MNLRRRWAWVGALASLAWVLLAIHVLVEGPKPEWPHQTPSGAPSWRLPPLTQAMVVLDQIIVPIAGASLLALFAFHAATGQWRAMRALLVFAVGGTFLSQALKVLVARSRPPCVALVEVSGYSFPSAQVLLITLVAGWATFVASANAQSMSTRLLVGASAAAAMLVVGFSRVYLGAHYPSDVAASILIGISWLCVCIAGRRPFHEDR